MKKRIVLICALLLLSVLLTGCCKEHEWLSATCTAPRTCTKCGETEGEMLNHSWQEATFQQPKTCAACGLTEGEVRTPAFLEHGLACDMKPGETYDYITNCSEDSTMTTVGTVTVTDVRVCEPGELEGLTEEEGYTWYSVKRVFVFSDDNAQSYGVSTGPCSEDYYDIILHDDSGESIEQDDSSFFAYMTSFTVNWNGVDYDRCLKSEDVRWSDWVDGVVTCSYTDYVRIPTGYDGWVAGCYNNANSGDGWAEGTYIYDYADRDSLFFRLIPSELKSGKTFG